MIQLLLNSMKNNIGVIDLFSGCGGSAYGFQQAGFPIRVAVDSDEWASKSFQLNFPNSVVLTSDITKISGKRLLEHGKFRNGNEVVLLACPPCQGFSNARRSSQRMTDPRNRLVFEFLRIVEEINPVAFVLENVPGLSSGVGKELFIHIQQILQELGYQMVYDVVNTADYGVPQKRKRLVVIGTNRSETRLVFPPKTHSDPTISNSILPKWKTVRETLADLPPINAGEKHNRDPLHVAANLAEINLERLKKTPHDGGDRLSWPKELILRCHQSTKGHKDVYGRIRWDSPSPTMTGGCGMISKGRYGHPEQDRAISLREAARLQSFPDIFKFVGGFGQIAKQIGNAVPPLLAEKTANQIKQLLAS